MNSSIHSKLLQGEEILWEGRPKIKGAFSGASISALLFGIVWLAFSLFWIFGTLLATQSLNISGVIETTDSSSDWMLSLFGIPFVIIGIIMVFVVPFSQTRKMKSTSYYLSDKRVMIHFDNGKKSSFSSVFINELRTVHLKKHMNNTSSILFPPFFSNARVYTEHDSDESYAHPTPDNCFYKIENADDVYKLIMQRKQVLSLKDN